MSKRFGEIVNIKTRQIMEGLEVYVVVEDAVTSVHFIGTGTVTLDEAIESVRQAERVLKAAKQLQEQRD